MKKRIAGLFCGALLLLALALAAGCGGSGSSSSSTAGGDTTSGNVSGSAE